MHHWTNASLAAGLVTCAVLAMMTVLPLEESEFAGGRVTGRLLDASMLGAAVFVLSALVLMRTRRLTMILGTLATALCLPLYVYRVAPFSVQRLGTGPWSVPATPGELIFNVEAILGLLSLAVWPLLFLASARITRAAA